MEKIKRSTVVREIADVTGISMKNTKLVLDAFQDISYGHIANGDRVVVFDGLIIGSAFRPSRPCYNPQTGEKMMSRPLYIPRVTFGRKIKDAANKQESAS